MLTLHIEAQTHAELCRVALATLGIQSVAKEAFTIPVPTPAPQSSTMTAAPESPAAVSVTLPQPAVRRTRGKRTETPPPSAAPAAVSPEAPATTADNSAPLAADKPVASVSLPAAPVHATIEQLRAGLGEYNEHFGYAKATAFLTSQGFDRVSIVPEDKRAGIIAAAKDAVAADKAKAAAAAAAKA